jgi:hypothetical protein
MGTRSWSGCGVFSLYELVASGATGGKAPEERSFKKLDPKQWDAKAGVQKLGPEVVN